MEQRRSAFLSIQACLTVAYRFPGFKAHFPREKYYKGWPEKMPSVHQVLEEGEGP